MLKKKKKVKMKRYTKKDRAEEFLSYEELPLDDYEKNLPRISKPIVKKMAAAAFIILLCFAVVFAFYNREKLTQENISNWFNYEFLGKARGAGYPSTIAGTSLAAGNSAMVNDYLVYSSNTSCVTLNSSAYQIFNRQITYSRPVMETAGSKILVYAQGDKGYMINTINANEHSGKAPDNIFCADVTKNGRTAFVTKADGYLCKLYAYDADHNEKYWYAFSECYINTVKLNNEGNKAVLGGIYAENAQEKMYIYLLDFYKEKPQKIFEFDRDIVLDIEFITDKTAVIVSKNSLYYLNINSGEIIEKSYNKMQLSGYDINTDTGCVVLSLSRSADGKNCDILYYNQVGDLIKTINTDLEVTSVSLYKDKIALLQKESAMLYNKEGELLGSAETGKDSRKILLNSEKSAYIIGINEIREVVFQ